MPQDRVQVRKSGGLIMVEERGKTASEEIPLFAFEGTQSEAQEVQDTLEEYGHEGYRVEPRSKDGKKVYVVRKTEQGRIIPNKSKVPLVTRIRSYWRSK